MPGLEDEAAGDFAHSGQGPLEQWRQIAFLKRGLFNHIGRSMRDRRRPFHEELPPPPRLLIDRRHGEGEHDVSPFLRSHLRPLGAELPGTRQKIGLMPHHAGIKKRCKLVARRHEERLVVLDELPSFPQSCLPKVILPAPE